VFQLRNLTIDGCSYSYVHQDLMKDLLKLSTSRYSQVWQHHTQTHTHLCIHIQTQCNMNRLCLVPQVRSKAQNALFTSLATYNFCCRDIIPAVLEYLDPDRTDVTQQQFKVDLS